MGKSWERRLKCFVVMPFGHRADERGVVHDMDNVYRELIVPAVDRVLAKRPGVHVDVTRADHVPGAGSIHREMFEQLLEADIAVVDLTLANPNVFYELGVRHALRDRVTVLIREVNTAIPFNINGQKITEYTVGFGTPTELIESIATDIATGLDGRADSQVLDLLGLESRARPHRLPAGPVYRAEIAGDPERSLEVVVGDLEHQCGQANIWVNSENNYFQMARVFDSSVSGTIRRLGCRTVDGRVIDAVFDELQAHRAGDSGPRDLFHVIITGSGGLRDSHGVERVCHLAAVQAEPGGGFRSASEVQRGVTAVVEAVESHLAGGSWEPVEGTARVLFPLMGTGTARERPAAVVSALLREAHRLLSADCRHQAIRSLQFLARTDVHLDLCLTEGERAGMELQLVRS